MTAQLDLLDAPSVPDWMAHPRDAIEEKFVAFHEANPGVYEMLEERALTAYRRGVKVGMRCLWENARWYWTMEVARDGDDFRLNDHHAPCYARLLLHRHPELRGMIETRGSR